MADRFSPQHGTGTLSWLLRSRAGLGNTGEQQGVSAAHLRRGRHNDITSSDQQNKKRAVLAVRSRPASTPIFSYWPILLPENHRMINIMGTAVAVNMTEWTHGDCAETET